jgi:hypothetical protein
MSLKIALIASAALAGAAGAALAADTTFLPGVYETVTTFADGAKETSRHCAKSHGAENDTLERRLAAMTRDPSCKFAQRAVGAGRFAIAATCANEGVTTSYKQSGTYGPANMTLAMTMTIQAAPGQAPVTSSFTAVSRRVGAVCPADMTEE